MNDTQFQSRLAAGVGGPELWNLRRETGLQTAKAFQAVGRYMASRANIPGGDGDAVRAMGCLLQMEANWPSRLPECSPQVSTMPVRRS